MNQYSGTQEGSPPPESLERGVRTRRQAFTGFGASLVFVLLFVLFFHFNFTTVIVSGQSMLPTLKNGKKVLVSNAYWLVGGIQDGNIVVIRDGSRGDYIIKRVYKMAGEYVDTFNAPVNWRLIDGEYKVPDGGVYVLGDNRAVSEDSRRFSAVDMSAILGKVVAY